MAYPDKPQILTSYTAEEQALGNGSLPGQELDVDFAALKASAEEVIDFLKLFTRSDGKLANGIVTQESLAASIRIGFDPPEVWATGRAYTTRSTVFQGSVFYLCTVAHTSGTFATDLSAGRWQLLADLTPVGGALLASNNLSDLSDAAAGRGNLGLGTMATLNAGTASTQFRNNSENDARFQPVDADLTAIAGLTSAADRLPYYTGAGTAALATFTSFARTLLDDADAATARTTLGAQASDGSLTTLSALSLAAGDLLVATGADTVARLAIGTAGQTLQVNAGATAAEWSARPGALSYSARQATTSGFTFDFTGIPATATEVEVYFDQVSLNAADDMLIQLGTSGGFVSTGYNSFSNDATYTTGMGVRAAAAARLGLGTMFLRKVESNIWLSASAINFSGTNTAGGGRIDLGGTLTQIRLTRLGGAATFDNGSASIAWRT